MATTAADIINIVKIRVRDTKNRKISASSYLDLLNVQLSILHILLINIMSQLVLSIDTFSTVADTQVYTGKTDILDGSVFVDTNDVPLVKTVEQSKQEYSGDTGQPYYFYQKNDTQIGLLPTPDKVYTITYTYTEDKPVMASSSSTIPYFGIWDTALTDALTVDVLDVLERTDQRAAIKAQASWDSALIRTYDFGIIKTMQVSEMFTASGV